MTPRYQYSHVEGIFVSPNLECRLSLRSLPERLNTMMAVISVLTIRPQTMQYDKRASSIACKLLGFSPSNTRSSDRSRYSVRYVIQFNRQMMDEALK